MLPHLLPPPSRRSSNPLVARGSLRGPAAATPQRLLPLRLVTKVAHLVATLVVLYDLDGLTGAALGKGSGDELRASRRKLESLAWAAVGCFILEFIGLFSGMSMFFPTVNSFNVLLHFVGIVLTALFVTNDSWGVGSYTSIFVFCHALPALLEIAVAFAVLKFKTVPFR